MSRVLVTGASGFLASHVVRQLLEAGEYRVRGTVRSLANETKVTPLRRLCPENAQYELELVEADLMNKASWQEAVKDCTYVIHVHVASPFPAHNPRDEMEVIGPAVEGAKNVLEACAKTKGGVKRVVLTSSVVAIYGGRIDEGNVFSEEDWSKEEGSSPYGKSKARAERAAWELVRNLPDDEKFELSTICPGFILGPVLQGSSCTNMEFHRRLLQREVPMVPNLCFAMCDVRDVAGVHIKATTSSKAPGNRYIAVTESMWAPEMAKILQDEFKPLGYNVRTRIAPKFGLRVLALFDGSVKMILPAVGKEIKADNSKLVSAVKEYSGSENWINNYNSKVSGCRQASKNKAQILHRRQSGYNLFTSDVMKKDNVGGSAEVFRTVGEKWKGLTEESKKEYRKKALEAGDNIPLSSNKEQALKIMKNMMKEVAELESLGGQCMVLCSYDGMLYHNESAICEKLIADKDLISSFGSLLHLSDKEKKDVSPKDLQEVFNNKYSILVEKKGQKMPYTRAKQLGIVFQNLPDTLAEEIGLDPRKPHLYGGAQRRKLWLSRDTWKLSISDAVIQSSSSTSIDSSSSSISTSDINPTTSLVTPAHTITTPSSTIIIPANTIITASSTPTFLPASSITSPGNHTYKPNTISTPINTTTTWSTTFTPSITLSSLHTTSITSPSKPISSPRTIITPSPTFFTAPSTCTSPPAAIVTSTTSPDSTTTTSLSTSSCLLVAASVPSSSSQPVTSSAGRSLLSMSCSTSGTIISKDTRFGMTVRENGEVHAVCTLCHGSKSMVVTSPLEMSWSMCYRYSSREYVLCFRENLMKMNHCVSVDFTNGPAATLF